MFVKDEFVFPLMLLWFEFDCVGDEMMIGDGYAGMVVNDNHTCTSVSDHHCIT